MRQAIHRDRPEWKLNVVSHIMTINLWEYYITDRYPKDSDIQEAYVMGFENELGDISMQEIAPYVISVAPDLSNILPPENFKWSSVKLVEPEKV